MGVTVVFLLDLKHGIIPAAVKKINHASRNQDTSVCFVWDPKACKFPVSSKAASKTVFAFTWCYVAKTLDCFIVL